MDHSRPWLRFVDADDLGDDGKKFSGMEVDGIDGEKLGKVEGFVIDVTNGRPYHVAVGAGSWFTHKDFLLPIGHVSFNADQKKLLADLTKDRVKKFPGFERAKIETLSAEELKQMENVMAASCCPDDVIVVDAWETRGHYLYPAWWQVTFYQPEGTTRTEEAGSTAAKTRSTAADNH
jgi:hypothetical protein